MARIIAGAFHIVFMLSMFLFSFLSGLICYEGFFEVTKNDSLSVICMALLMALLLITFFDLRSGFYRYSRKQTVMFNLLLFIVRIPAFLLNGYMVFKGLASTSAELTCENIIIFAVLAFLFTVCVCFASFYICEIIKSGVREYIKVHNTEAVGGKVITLKNSEKSKTG